MKNVLLVASVLAAIGAPAFAADLPVRTYMPTKAPPPVVSPAYDWSGFNGGEPGFYSSNFFGKRWRLR
jgi:outer membrane immunogenic protein